MFSFVGSMKISVLETGQNDVKNRNVKNNKWKMEVV